MDYMKARGHCASLGGILASIHSKEENMFITNMALANKNSTKLIFVGLSATPSLYREFFNVKDSFMFEDRSPFDYNFWSTNQPDLNKDHNRACVVLNTRKSGEWENVECATELNSICQQDVMKNVT